MSSADTVDLRPKRPLRIAVLIAAVACLGLTMCVRSEKRPPAKPAPSTQQGATPEPQPAQQQQTKPAEGDMAKEKPEYFNATKAPGGFYK